MSLLVIDRNIALDKNYRIETEISSPIGSPEGHPISQERLIPLPEIPGGVGLNVMIAVEHYSVRMKQLGMPSPYMGEYITCTQDSFAQVKGIHQLNGKIHPIVRPQGDSICHIYPGPNGEPNQGQEVFEKGGFEPYNLSHIDQVEDVVVSTNFTDSELWHTLDTLAPADRYWILVAHYGHVADGNLELLTELLKIKSPKALISASMNIDEFETMLGQPIDKANISVPYIQSLLDNSRVSLNNLILTLGDFGGIIVKYTGKVETGGEIEHQENWFYQPNLSLDPERTPVNWSGSGDLTMAILVSAIAEYETLYPGQPMNPDYMLAHMQMAIRATHFNSESEYAVSTNLPQFFESYDRLVM